MKYSVMDKYGKAEATILADDVKLYNNYWLFSNACLVIKNEPTNRVKQFAIATSSVDMLAIEDENEEDSGES